MLRPGPPSAPRGHLVHQDLRARLRAGAAAVLALVAGGALRGVPAADREATRAPPPALVPGQVLHAARLVTLRTRGGGNLTVDLPRGRAIQVIAVKGETVILGPGRADTDLLRQFGVRRIPRYAATRAQIESEFLAPPAWMEVLERERRRLRGRWPDLTLDQADRILQGEPWAGMTLEQAEEAVGAVVFFRERREGPDGPEEIWRIGRRPRSAELRLFTEGRERGIRSKTFEDYLAGKMRAILRFRGGALLGVEAP